MRSIGIPELLVILGIAVLLFGGRKIPEVAKGFRRRNPQLQERLEERGKGREEAGLGFRKPPAIWADISQVTTSEIENPATAERGLFASIPVWFTMLPSWAF